jgi:hypothetical protein
VAHKWLTGTSLQGASRSYFAPSTYGSAIDAIDKASGKKLSPLEPLEAILGGLHQPTGMACVLHERISTHRDEHGVDIEPSLGDIDMCSFQMCVDYLVVLVLDIVDAKAQPEPSERAALERIIDADRLWPCMHGIMEWCIRKVVQHNHTESQPAELLLLLLASSIRLLLPLRLVHGSLGPANADTRAYQIRTWLGILCNERVHAKAYASLHKDDCPSFILNLQLAHLHAGLASLFAEVGGAGAREEALPGPVARLLPFATVESDACIFAAVLTLTDGEPTELYLPEQHRCLYHALALADTWALRAQCMLATTTRRACLHEVHAAMNTCVLHYVGERASLLHPWFAASHLPRPPVQAELNIDHLPWEPAASYALLLGDILLAQGLARTSSEPLSPVVIEHLVRGSGLHALPEDPQVVGLIDMLAYSSAREPLHKDEPWHWWPAAAVVEWVADFGSEPAMLLKQPLLETWVVRGIQIAKRELMAPMGGDLRGSMKDYMVDHVTSSLTRGMLVRLGERYAEVAPPTKSVLIAPSGERTSKIVALLDVAVQAHDACKSLLRIVARPAITAALLLAYPLRILGVLERLLRHPLFVAWPKRYAEEMQARVRFLRSSLDVMSRLREHAMLTVERLSAANRMLHRRVGEPLTRLRSDCLAAPTDFTTEVRRRSALHRLASLTQQLIVQLRNRFVTQKGQGKKRLERVKPGWCLAAVQSSLPPHFPHTRTNARGHEPKNSHPKHTCKVKKKQAQRRGE